jgi:hypothetical protein
MKGLLKHNGKEWVVTYTDFIDKVIPLYRTDVEKEVDFEIVDEFSHEYLFYNVGWGEGPPCAKLTTNVLK